MGIAARIKTVAQLQHFLKHPGSYLFAYNSLSYNIERNINLTVAKVCGQRF